MPENRKNASILRSPRRAVKTELGRMTSPCSTLSSPNGVPSWEHPETKESEQKSKKDLPPKFPKRQISNSILQPPESSAGSQTDKSKASTFENMGIILELQDSSELSKDVDQNPALVTSDHSVQKSLLQQRANHMAIIAERSRTHDRENKPPSQTRQKQQYQPPPAYGQFDTLDDEKLDVSTKMPADVVVGASHSSALEKGPLANTKSFDIDPQKTKTSRTEKNRTKQKSKTHTRGKNSSKDGMRTADPEMEEATTSVSLGHLYSNWKDQSHTIAVGDGTTSTTAAGENDSLTNSAAVQDESSVRSCDNNAAGSDDQRSIQEALALQQEQMMIELALERSLLDVPPTNIGGDDNSTALSPDDACTLASRNTENNGGIIGRRRPPRSSCSSNSSDLSGAGCHLAMMATHRHAAVDNNDNNSGVDSTQRPAVALGSTFVWKRDSVTNSWIKAPVH